MKGLQLFLFIFMFSFTEQTTAQRDIYPPWSTPDNTSITGCSCVKHDAKVNCGPDFTFLQYGFSMTYNSTTGATEYGPCPYIAHYNTTAYIDVFHITLPSNVSSLNEFMCGPLNREGELCGKCKDGYGIALYSYTEA